MRRDPLQEVAAIKAWADAEFAAKGPKAAVAHVFRVWISCREKQAESLSDATQLWSDAASEMMPALKRQGVSLEVSNV